MILFHSRGSIQERLMNISIPEQPSLTITNEPDRFRAGAAYSIVYNLQAFRLHQIVVAKKLHPFTRTEIDRSVYVVLLREEFFRAENTNADIFTRKFL